MTLKCYKQMILWFLDQKNFVLDYQDYNCLLYHLSLKPASHTWLHIIPSISLNLLWLSTSVTSTIDWDFTDWVLLTFVGLHHQRPGGAGPSADDWGRQEHQGQARPGEDQDGGREQARTELPGPAGSPRKVWTLMQALC